MSLKKFREEILAEDPLRDYFVFWDDVSLSDIEFVSIFLEKANKEEDMQKYLEMNPLLLIQHLGGGHGRWVIPEKRLGSEYTTDFMIGERNSSGFWWTAVELESPKMKMFTKKGDMTKELTHAIRQIVDWRSWLKINQNYAARTRTENGLGLTDIDSDLPGLIIIGRRSDTPEGTKQLRRQIISDLNIEIHSYDWLIENGLCRIEALRGKEYVEKNYNIRFR